MKNPVVEAIRSRRSIRAYEPKPVSRDILNTIIEAGNQAPFLAKVEKGEILQPWRFVVVEDPKFRQKLIQITLPVWKKFNEGMKETNPQIYNMAMMFYEATDEPKDMVYHNAPVIIFVIGSAEAAISCALACENMMLAAHALGLGSCYVGLGSNVKSDASVIQALELKDNEQIYGPIVLGYPKDSPAARALRMKRKAPILKWI